MAAWGYEFHLLVLKVSLTGVSEEILSALEDKIHIPARPCNILYNSHACLFLRSCQRIQNVMHHMIWVVTASLSKQNTVNASTLVDFGSYK